ncbi:hypothetical protein AWE51_19355 [Aquimarina aggregata]|uniref:Dihydrolipoamide dehydrogenase n=2 Tax=Aquimarina aggregata TaxID=1642818 RepID=A0A162WMS7_9FLAO|nr:hypothetical protein AWE51_19355 [Aquimarina aggregata]
MTTTITAQIKTPAPSTSAKVIQTVGLTDIEIAYSRPSANNRLIFGDQGLIPYGKLWRTGANAATKITFGDEVTISGKKLKEGAYAILTKPGASAWEVYFYTYETGNWSNYKDKKPALVATVNSILTNDKTETLTIGFDDIKMNSASLLFLWENTKIALPFVVDVDDKAMASIKSTLAGPTAIDYFRAASYMHDAGKDLNTALSYIQKANNSNPRFFQLRREALILADLGRKKEAIVAAKKSTELAIKAKNDDFVRLNEKSIKEWSK